MPFLQSSSHQENLPYALFTNPALSSGLGCMGFMAWVSPNSMTASGPGQWRELTEMNTEVWASCRLAL